MQLKGRGWLDILKLLLMQQAKRFNLASVLQGAPGFFLLNNADAKLVGININIWITGLHRLNVLCLMSNLLALQHWNL